LFRSLYIDKKVFLIKKDLFFLSRYLHSKKKIEKKLFFFTGYLLKKNMLYKKQKVDSIHQSDHAAQVSSNPDTDHQTPQIEMSEVSDSDSLENLVQLCGEDMDSDDHMCQLRSTPPHTSQPCEESNEEEPRAREEEIVPMEEEYSNPSCSQNSTQNTFRIHPSIDIDTLKTSELANADRFSNFYLPRTTHEYDLLSIPPDLLGDMKCKAKSLYVEAPSEPTNKDGLVYSFVFKAENVGIPKEAMRVIYFFSKLSCMAAQKPLDGCCARTENLQGEISMPQGKTTHIVSFVQPNESAVNEDEDMADLYSTEGGINLNKLIELEDSNIEGRQKRREPILTIRIGITGAASEYIDSRTNESKCKHTLYFVVHVTFPVIIHPPEYIINYLLATPPANANVEIRRENTEMCYLLQQILLYQAAHVIGDTSGALPSAYYSNPTGKLGISTICNPFMDPLKILRLFERSIDGEITLFKIIGYYNIDWHKNPVSDPKLKAYMRYYSTYSGHVERLYSDLEQAIEALNTGERRKKRKSKKEKPKNADAEQQPVEEQMEDVQEFSNLTFLLGFPLLKDTLMEDGVERSYFVKFTRNLAPIILRCVKMDFEKPQTFEHFCINFGILPEAVRCWIMDFLLFDYQFPHAPKMSDYILCDREPADGAKLHQKYFSKNTMKFEGIIYAGCLSNEFEIIVKRIIETYKKGKSNPECVLQTFDKTDMFSYETFQGMVDSGLLQSEFIENMKEIMNCLKRAENSLTNPLEVMKEMLEYKQYLLKSMSKNDVDPYVQAVEFLYKSLGDANKYWRLNPINLKNLFFLLKTALHFVIPRNSATVPGFGQGIFLAPACGNFYELTQNKIILPVAGCLNSTGKDLTVDIFNQLMNKLSLLLNAAAFAYFIQLTRGTAVSFEYACSAAYEKDKLKQAPDPRIVFQPIMDTEMRGQDLNQYLQTLVNNVASRGNGQLRMSMSTSENKETGQRSTETRFVTQSLSMGYMCMNPQQVTPVTAELLETLFCVLCVTPPGSSYAAVEDKSGNFGNVSANFAQARSTHFEGETERGAVILLALTHSLTYMRTLLPLWAGAGPLNISPVVLSALDFVLFYIKKHLYPMFKSKNGERNFQRLANVYISRACTFSSWILTIQSLCENENREEALKEARRKFQFDALNITDVPSVGYELICRIIDWGPVILAFLFIQEVKMPIVPLKILQDLLRANSKPTSGELHSYYVKIQRWLNVCVERGRFCPPSGFEESPTMCEYISSDENSLDGSVDCDYMLRTTKSTSGWNNQVEGGKDKVDACPEKFLAETICSIHRKGLLENCSFTPGAVRMSLRDMISGFSVHLEKFLEIPQSDVNRFMSFFEIRHKIPFVPYKTEKDSLPPFAIKTARFQGREAKSSGIGIHVLQLLMLGALTGEAAYDMAHPNMVYALGRGLIKYITEKMPGGAVPRPQIYIASFNNVHNNTIIPRPSINIEHFIRPKDLQLALTGVPSHFSNVRDTFAPEDVLHMPGLCSVASYFTFKIQDCPPTDVNYHIRANRIYCIYNKGLNRLGVLRYNEPRGRIEVCHYPNSYEIVSNVVDDADDEQDDAESNGKRDSSGSEEDEYEDDGVEENEVDTSQHMEEEGAADQEGEEDDDEDEEKEVNKILEVKTWQRQLFSMGYIMLPMIHRGGACVTVADEDLGERIGVLVPPPDKENADGNFHIKKRGYCVSVTNSRARNHIYLSPFQVFDSLIPIGKEVYLKMESDCATQFKNKVGIRNGDSNLHRFAIRMIMCSPNVFEPEVGMAYVTYLFHGDQSSAVICVHPSDLLIRPGRRTVIKHVHI